MKGPRFSLPMGLTQRRLILWVSAVIIVLCGGILCAAYVFRPLLKNAIEGRAVATLRSEFASDVRFQAFDTACSLANADTFTHNKLLRATQRLVVGLDAAGLRGSKKLHDAAQRFGL